MLRRFYDEILEELLCYNVVLCRENNGEETRNIDTGRNETRFLVTALKPFTTYSFRVAAQNTIGHSAPSKESFQTQTHRESKAADWDALC